MCKFFTIKYKYKIIFFSESGASLGRLLTNEEKKETKKWGIANNKNNNEENVKWICLYSHSLRKWRKGLVTM